MLSPGNLTPDLPTVDVTEDEQENCASRLELACSARVSAKTGQGVDEAFERLVFSVYEAEHGRGEEKLDPPKVASPRGIVLTNTEPAVAETENECCWFGDAAEPTVLLSPGDLEFKGRPPTIRSTILNTL